MTSISSRRSTPYHRLEIYQPEPPRTTAAAMVERVLAQKATDDKVVRSVVAGVLLKFSPFLPFQLETLLDSIQNHHLLSNFEKQLMLKLQFAHDERSALLLSIQRALHSLEKDTAAVSCFKSFAVDFETGIRSKRITIMSVKPDKLVAELLPSCLYFNNLSLTSEDMFPDLNKEIERQKEIEMLLSEF